LAEKKKNIILDFMLVALAERLLCCFGSLTLSLGETQVNTGCTEAVFLVVCDPSMNEL
jgi:hypothetical protein